MKRFVFITVLSIGAMLFLVTTAQAATSKKSTFGLTVEPIDCVLYALQNGSAQLLNIDPINCLPLITPDPENGGVSDITVTNVATPDQQTQVTVNTETRDESRSERLFEGTVIEPLAKALDVDRSVSPSTNRNINIAMSATMVIIVLTLAVLIVL